MLVLGLTVSAQQQAGSIRGVVYDKDFNVPLGAVQVTNVETGQVVISTDQGNYVVDQVPPGKYTLVFSKEGYVRQVKADVLVTAGQLTDLDASLAGEFTELDEFVVQDILLGYGTEAALLQLRFESPSLMDSISSDLMSRAGASDAAAALKLVTGASVQNDKFAVIRGLPDRYVSSQMNGVRLPTADEDKRAVELDQFPAAVIDSIQVSKTFTPDQQGDASGGAVDVRLKNIPDEAFVQVQAQSSYNSQATGNGSFLTYHGGGLNTWGKDQGGRDIQTDKLGESWDGAVGVSEGSAPTDYKWSLSAGGKHALENGLKLGGFANFFYERDSSFYDDGIDDSYWVENPGDPMTPRTNQGTPEDGDFKTALFDVTQGKQSVQWGGLSTIGVESENHSLDLTYLYTRTAEDTATLAEDTRGKQYFFPGYDPNDPTGTGNEPENRSAAPYLRLETLEYTERTTTSLQLHGKHTLPIDSFELTDAFTFRSPELDWIVADSSATLDQPDKRQFGALWLPRSYSAGAPPFIPPFFYDPTWFAYKPGANFNLGNLQRIWKDIEEDSNQYAVNLQFPFEQWSGNEGFLEAGIFRDAVDREFNQDTFSNFGDSGSSFEGDWTDFWSEVPERRPPDHRVALRRRCDGEQDISAWYTMLDLPLSSSLTAVGARFSRPSSASSTFPGRDVVPAGSGRPSS
jgi:hypothetical protein